jgi:hypothetical protein
MNEKLQDDLVKTYPKIFKNVGGDETKTCMAHGIQCNDGWYDLLDSLCYRISMYCMTENTRYIPETDKYEFVLENDPAYMQVVAAQVKEKMGELRFYADGGDATIQGMIQMAEQMSKRICELCGSPAKTSRDSGWWHTTCDACSKRIRLERQGWKSGSAEEFLADTDSAVVQSHCTVCGVPWASHMGIAGTCAENAQLRRERDEARREVCEMNAIESSNESVDFLSLTPQDIADERGWDCYASDTLSQDVKFYISQDAKLRKGIKQAKEGKFSKTPPKIKPTKKKKKK